MSTSVLWLGMWLAGCSGMFSGEPAADPVAVTPSTKAGKAKSAPKAQPTPAEPLTPRLQAAPNVLWVVLDTVRADRMSLYGYDKPTTPKLAAWAKEHAVVYDRAVSPGVWTLPSHASLFTAMPVRGHGVTADHKWLDDGLLTAAEAFTDAGYDTYAFVANPHMSPDTNILSGFAKKEHPWSPKWRRQAAKLLRSKLIDEDASTAVSPKFAGRGGAGNNKYLFKESGPLAAEALLKWEVDRAERDRPFFAFLNYMEVHLPRIPRLETRKKVMTDAEIERSLTVEQTTVSLHEWMVGVRTFDDLDIAAISGVYDASLIELDADVVGLMERLEQAGLADDTIVVITSDHGELLGERGLMLHKYTVHSALSRVPFLVSWPGHLAPGREDAPISVADALPLVVSLGDIPLDPTVRAALEARPTTRVDGVVTEFNAVADGSLKRMGKLHPEADLSRLKRTFQAIEHGPHKFVEASDGSRELYEILADPQEDHDVVSRDAATAAELSDLLRTWRDAVPAYAPSGQAPAKDLSPELRQGLEALGYMD